MELIKEQDGIAIYNIGARFYVVGINDERGQVTSVCSSDMPADGGTWFAPISANGVQYVSRGRTRKGALAAFRRALKKD